MEDGGPVSRQVSVVRVCGGNPIHEAHTDSSGAFSYQAGQNLAMIQEASADTAMMPEMQSPPGPTGGAFGAAGGYTSLSPSSGSGLTPEMLMMCDIRAELPGYRSDEVPLADKVHDFIIDVGTIVLHPIGKISGTMVSVTSLKAPKDAKKAVEKGRKAGLKEKYTEALEHFQKAVEIDPHYAEAWYFIGEAQQKLNQAPQAEESFHKAQAEDASYVPPYLALAQIAAGRADWTSLAEITDKLLALDPYEYPVAYFYNSAAYYNLHREDRAERSAQRAERLDSQHKIPKINLLLAQILVQKKNYPAAADQLRTFLKYSPDGKDAEMARDQLDQLQKSSGEAQAKPPQSNPQKP